MKSERSDDCWDSDVYNQLEKCDVWSGKFGFVRHAINALTHLAAWAKVEYVRHDKVRESQKIDVLVTSVLKPKSKECVTVVCDVTWLLFVFTIYISSHG